MLNSQFSILIRTEPYGTLLEACTFPQMGIENWELSIGQISFVP
jgi:hypothetical protein